MEKATSGDSLSAVLKVTIYFLAIIGAAWLAGRVTVLDSIFFYFGIALLLSFVFLRSEGKSLSDLGIRPESRADWKHFAVGVAVGIAGLLASAGLSIWLNHGHLKWSGRLDPVYLLILTAVHLWSSFVQEFTYRGYPFQRLLRSYGPWTAQLAITLPFAIMHFKLNIPITAEQFFMTWLTTGLGSILYGLCYLRTGKLLLPIGLHMGWNLAQALVPRSAEENKTALFTLTHDAGSYTPMNVLWPYIGVTVAMIVVIGRWRKV